MQEVPGKKFKYLESAVDSTSNNRRTWVLHDAGGSTAGEIRHNGSTKPYKACPCPEPVLVVR
jgi:hypothetical protein